MNLPANLSHFVFCQYSFFNLTEMLVVAPNMDSIDNKKEAKPNAKATTNSNTFKFDHQQDFTVLVTEEFLEYVQEDALSIEVWGHRSGGEDFDSLEESSVPKQETTTKNISNGLLPALTGPQFDANGRLVNKHNLKEDSLCMPRDIAAQKRKSLQERWAEVTKRIEMWVEIKEMNDSGEYVNVDVTAQSGGADKSSKNGCSTGGVYQLKQGQQRRLTVRVRGVDFEHSGGTLPLSFSDILSVGIGSIVVKEGNSMITSNGYSNPDYYGASNWNLSGEENLWCNRTEASRPLDSYQEEDLDRIREQWSRALACRHQYLESQINELALKGSTKNELEVEREQSLINQWVELTEERNAVSLPSSNSYIPGAPADWQPPSGIEYHVPVVFLDLDAEELAADEAMEDEECATFGSKIAGLNTMLPYEKFEQTILLPVLEKDSLEMSATCSWDSSIHFCHALNRPSNAGEMVFAIINATCRLSYPFSMDLVIRKRICLNIYKKPSFTDRIMRRIAGMGNITGTGVFYDVVAHIPKSSLDMEDRATLALMAVRHTTCLEDENSKPFTSLSGELVEQTESLDSKTDIPPANQTTMGNNCWSYVEVYTKSIQAVEWMLKLDRLRQESAMLNMLSRQEQRGPRVSHYSQQMSNLRMKRTISLPNTSANMALPPIPPRIPVTANASAKGGRRSGFTSTERDLENGNQLCVNDHRLMEVSASSSSGYSSMANSTSRPTSLNLISTKRPSFLPMNSMVSPLFDNRLSGIDEEQVAECLTKDAVIRSSTVPETLHQTNNIKFHAKMTPPHLYTPSNSESQDSLNNNSNEFSLPVDLISTDLNSSDESNLSCTNHLFEQHNPFNQFEDTELSTPSLLYSNQTSNHPKVSLPTLYPQLQCSIPTTTTIGG
uniref:Kinesin-like domain-containing protein n=1 Tax=Ditylenchus dipsaci TaxID=166011 RepID=A0A915DQE0_9BILA